MSLNRICEMVVKMWLKGFDFLQNYIKIMEGRRISWYTYAV